MILDGPKAIAEFVWEYNLSTIKQFISITIGSKRVNIETEVNWNESKKKLRASFPINIHTKEATCDSDGTVHMHFGFDVKSVQIVNLLEQELEQEEIAYQHNICDFFIKPFEIVTLKILWL